MNSGLVSESLNEFQGMPDKKPYLYVFIDEEHYDYYASDLENDRYNGKYDGYSELPVHMSMEDIDPYDDLEVNSIDRDSLPIVGKVLVGFNEEQQSVEVLEMLEGNFHVATMDEIIVLFPEI